MFSDAVGDVILDKTKQLRTNEGLSRHADHIYVRRYVDHSYNGEEIQGSFYEQELQKTKKQEIFRIGK